MYLEFKNPVKNQYRFYRMTVQRSLFGNLILTRTWGRIGSKQPREIHQEFADADTLMREFRWILTVRQRHGYQLIRDSLVIPYPSAQEILDPIFDRDKVLD
jgi:predicted DNA-binding WGR domain protein